MTIDEVMSGLPPKVRAMSKRRQRQWVKNWMELLIWHSGPQDSYLEAPRKKVRPKP